MDAERGGDVPIAECHNSLELACAAVEASTASSLK